MTRLTPATFRMCVHCSATSLCPRFFPPLPPACTHTSLPWPWRSSNSPLRLFSPPPTRTTALRYAHPRLRSKGALSLRGEVLKAVVLSNAEEDELGVELLVLLCEAGAIK